MIEDLEYFLEKLKDQQKVNEIVIIYKDKVNKINRENYYPDENGSIVFHKKQNVSETGYSVSEMTELLERYGELIKEFSFQTWDDSLQPFVNIYESKLYSAHGSYTCAVTVGNAGEGVLKMPGKVNDDSMSWASDILYPELIGIKSQL